jgi:hypothetical protein
MYAATDNTTPIGTEHAVDPTHRPAGKLVGGWARGRRRITPWAYPRLRALAIMRFAIGLFLLCPGALLLSHGDYAWAAVPLAGALLHFTIASLDTAVVRSPALRV